MMNINEINKEIDSLYQSGKIDEAETYMKNQLTKAKEDGNMEVQMVLTYTLADFYRAAGKYDDAVEKYLESESVMQTLNMSSTRDMAAVLFNLANIYRITGKLDEAYKYFDKTLHVIEICGDDNYFLSYYNNLSALHQSAGKLEESIDCLKKALYITDQKMNDDLRSAMARTNLAAALLRLKRADEAREHLAAAISFYESRPHTDYHYSTALSAMGDVCMVKGDLEKAAEYFERALPEIEQHMGQNQFYSIVSDNLESVYKMMGGRPNK